MQLPDLAAFLAVATERSFSAAARRMHRTQPAISQAVRRIEDELGERLFHRMKREAKPTPYGEIFLRRAVKILEEADAARREASDAQNLLRGTLTLGVLPTIAPYLLPDLLVAR